MTRLKTLPRALLVVIAAAAALAAAVVGFFMAIPFEEEAPLSPGVHVSDALNNPAALDGATLTVAESLDRAVFEHGGSRTVLELSRPSNASDAARPGCRTLDTIALSEQLAASGTLPLPDGPRRARWLHARCPSGFGVTVVFEDDSVLRFVPKTP